MAYELAKNEIDILVLDEFLECRAAQFIALGEALASLIPCLWISICDYRQGLPEEIKERSLISEVQGIKHLVERAWRRKKD